MKLFKNTKKAHTTLELLNFAFESATKNGGLIELTHQLRSDPSKKITHEDLISLFENLSHDWIKVSGATGHVTFKNLVTKMTVGFSGHIADGTLNSHVKKDTLDIVQQHLNILCNEIFHYHGENWKFRPDFNASNIRYEQWMGRHEHESTSPSCA